MEKGMLEHKVGIRIFDEMGLENVFPMYENLENKIKDCRQAARGRRCAEKERYQDNYMYDNVFSILGKRGTGKTSVAFTLRERILGRSSETKDVVLPIIIPEVIPENCSVLGWILAIIKDEIDSLENRMKKQNPERRAGVWENCHYGEHTDENLSRKLDELSKMLFAGKYNPSNENSYYTVVNNSAAQAESYYCFAKKITEFWDLWVKTLQMADENAEESCPLIYFIFDDVDLAPEKINEILSVITKYLSHPNVIVITTADEELLLEVLENKLDKNIDRLPREWRKYLVMHAADDFEMLELEDELRERRVGLISETTRMYLGKVMPPSTRYYLRTFHTAIQKENFYLTQSDTLGVGMKNEIEKLVVYARKTKETVENFMQHDGKIINFYLNFFGDTSRQIGNIYIGIKELIGKLCLNMRTEQKEFVNRIYEDGRYFISIVFRANHNMCRSINAVEDFIDHVFLIKYRGWNLYINYAYINDFFEKHMQGNRQEKLLIGLQIYSLMAFVENLLLILEGCNGKKLSGRKQISVVKQLAEYINKNVFYGHSVLRADLSASEFFASYNELLGSLYEICADTGWGRNTDVEYFYAMKEAKFGISETVLRWSVVKKNYYRNQKNFWDIVRMVTMVYGNAYLITEELLQNSMPQYGRKYGIGYEQYIYNVLRENCKKFSEHIDLQEFAKCRLEDMNAIIKKHEEEKDSNKRKNEFLNQICKKVAARKKEAIMAKKQKNQKEKEDGLKEPEDGELRYSIPLSTILNVVEGERLSLKEILSYLPDDVVERLKEEVKSPWELENLQEILSEQTAMYGKVEENRKICFYDLEEWFKLTDELMSSSIAVIRERARQVQDILYRAYVYDKDEMKIEELAESWIAEVGEGDIDELKQELNDILINLEEGSSLWIKVRDLCEDVDVSVDLNNDAERRKAVDAGLYLELMKHIQHAYLAHSICRAYAMGNYLSSGKLRVVQTKGKTQKTYYYQMFEILKERMKVCMSGSQKGDALSMQIFEVIRACRRNYIDDLFEEM